MRSVIISTSCVLFLILLWAYFYFFSGEILTDFSQELTGPLYSYISEENWEAAEASILSISEEWETNKALFYTLSSHTVVREADVAMARLNEFILNKEVSDAHAEIGEIRELFLSIRQGEAFTVDNIF
ncbi:MAG: DUF4363 family protein [Firmicutes bacterium]|nr:DUF4363 family protein [Clostridiales bacterium]MBQ4340413.1 DUF4363 family protein [Bacillota bacterium]